MTSAVQVQYRRGTSSQVASFTGAAGEMVVDTTNNRVVVQDGTTAGGFAAAKLAEVVTNTRTQVSDGNYTALVTDRTVAYITLTASRVVALPTAASYPTGSRLLAVDESGACSGAKTITLDANGSDLIDGAATAVINSAYGYLAIESNGLNKWTIIDQVGSAGGVSSINGLTGTPSLASSGGSTVTASGSSIVIGEPGGHRNGFTNAAMDVWQRGTSGTATTTAGPATQMSADGWYVVPTGGSVTWTQASGRLVTKNSLQVTGASSVTDVTIKQRIESMVAARYCSQTVTVQAQVYNGTGTSITPKLTVNRATGIDNGTYTNVDVSAASLQACANGAWTQVAYTFAANANSYNGLEIVFDFGNNFSAGSKTLQITELDIRVTPGVTTGLNSNPPPPELRPIGTEFVACLRYLQVWSAATTMLPISQAASSAAAYTTLAFFLPMRIVPSVTATASGILFYSTASAGVVESTAISFVNISTVSVLIDGTTSGMTAGQAIMPYVSGGSIIASAEL